MAESQPKRYKATYSCRPSSKIQTYHRDYPTEQLCTQLLVSSRSDEEGPIMERRGRRSRNRSPDFQSKPRTQRISYRIASMHRRSTITTPDVTLKTKIPSTKEQLSEESCDLSSERKLRSNDAAECPSDVTLDRLTRDEIVGKISTCVSFYGNFVIVPAIKETLDNIETADNNVKFSYWHEVMAFIDSYDLPYASESRKQLVDELVEEITKYVEKQGISATDWQHILCTLPDDVCNKFDHRLDDTVIEEVTALAKEDQLPFNLSDTILQILKSAKKHAGNYIRHTPK